MLYIIIVKKIIFAAIAVLIVCGVIFWFFIQRNERVSIIDDQQVEDSVSEDGVVSDVVSEEEYDVPVQKKEFTEFGDFWIEINKGDDLSVKAPVLGGVDKQALKRGVGHHTTTALPNPDSGNVVLSGHRWLPGSNPASTVFRHLDKLAIGDDISLFHEGQEYVYRVRQSKTVSNDAVEILDQTDSPQLTLYTCTPIFTALKRLVYIADLIEVR